MNLDLFLWTWWACQDYQRGCTRIDNSKRPVYFCQGNQQNIPLHYEPVLNYPLGAFLTTSLWLAVKIDEHFYHLLRSYIQ
jgi:hypothetical protein